MKAENHPNSIDLLQRSGTIHFETNLPSLPKVEVPLTVNVWTP